VAGGDAGGVLSGSIHLATSTNSTAGGQIFNAASNAFTLVGSLNTAREAAAAVALPNGLTLVIGGQTCAPASYGGENGFQCNALNTAELYNETTKTFTLAGANSAVPFTMTSARSGPSATVIEGSGTSLDGQVLIVGGSKGSSFLSVIVPPPSSGVPSGQVGLNTAELYNPANDSFTALTNTIPTPFLCPGTSSPITSTAEVGTTVTVTSAANPAGLTVGDNVSIEEVSVVGYNGTFPVTAIPSGTTFQYTVTPTSLAAGSGGMAAADTFQCGMVDQGAAVIPNSSGKVLLAGGDYIEFLGESSFQAFIFNPATQTFSATGSLNIPREDFALIAMDPSVVTTGPLVGDVVAFGGLEATSANCIINSTSSGTVVVTTLSTAEIYNPTTQTWSLASPAASAITSTSDTCAGCTGAAPLPSTVTVTSAANPAGLTVGGGVTVVGVNVAGYNGAFVVSAIPSGTTFQYTTAPLGSALAAGTGGTAQGNTMGVKRLGYATLFETGPLAGDTILAGGVDVEAGTLPATCASTTGIKQAAESETDLFDPFTGANGVFTATGALNQAREGAAQAVIGAGTDETDVIVIGGACTTPIPSLQSVTIGTSQAATTCGTSKAENDYSELYSQSSNTWTVGPAPAGGIACTPGPTCFTPTNAAASAVLP